MSIGILGAGALESNVARLLAKNGIPATIANSRGPKSLAGLLKELGPSVTTGIIEEAASADIVFVALHWTDLEKVLGAMPVWNGRCCYRRHQRSRVSRPEFARCQGPQQSARYLWAQADRSRRQAFQRRISPVRSRRSCCQGVQPSRCQDAAESKTFGWPTRAVLFRGRCRCESSGSQDHRTDRLFRRRSRRLDVGGPLTSPPFGALTSVNFVKI